MLQKKTHPKPPTDIHLAHLHTYTNRKIIASYFNAPPPLFIFSPPTLFEFELHFA